MQAKVDSWEYIYNNNNNCIGRDLADTPEFYNNKKLPCISRNYCSPCLPTNSKVRIFLTSTDTLFIPRIEVRIDAVPGEINYIDLTFNKVGIVFSIGNPIWGNSRLTPILLNIVDYSDYLMHKNIINSITLVLYIDAITAILSRLK